MHHTGTQGALIRDLDERLTKLEREKGGGTSMSGAAPAPTYKAYRLELAG